MKKYCLLLSILLATLYLSAYPVQIRSWDINGDIKTLNEKHYSIDLVNRNTGTIIVYLKQDNDLSELQALGFSPERMPEPHLDYARDLWESTKDSTDTMNAYYSYSEYITFMQSTAAQYPDICQLVQYGTTIQNRPMYFMKISDNVSVAENEPEFRYTSSIHGDEVVGYDMLIRLIQLLTSQYATNTRIADIVNNTEIWINPMYNPDGYALQQRYNANGIDLNRNFPMPTGNQHPDGNEWASENVAFMNHANGRHFIQSMNFHGGALVINYPWDYTYTLAPDDAMLQDMSLTYSIHNSPLYNSTEFEDGITNGAAWYVITGSLQDWNYGLTDCIDITAEIGTNKWPPVSQLDTFWSQNQESMLSYLEYARKGVYGTVTSTSGTPIDATIRIAGNTRAVHTDPAVGDYHRLLMGGTYSVTASAQGYIAQTSQVTIPANGSANLNFILNPATQTTFTGIVRDVDGFPIPQAVVSIASVPPVTATTAVDGTFLINSIYEGAYPLTITAPGFPPFSGSLSITTADNHQVFILSQPVFNDGFESGIANWTVTSPWAIALDSGNNVLKDSPTGNYGNNINKSARLTNPIAMQNMTNPNLTFRAKFALESGYDFVYVEASPNNSNWTELGNLTGTQSTWQNYSYSLSAYAGQNCYIRFRIVSDTSVNADGISIDDVQITANQANVAIYGDVDNNGQVNYTDYKAVLDYTVGLDPLPTIDPLPWTTTRIEAADVNNDSIVNSLDSYLIRKYTLNAEFRFPAQSGDAYSAVDPQISVTSLEGVVIELQFQNPAAVNAVDATLGLPDALDIDNVLLAGEFLASLNPVLNKYAVICEGITPNGIVFEITPQAQSTVCTGTANGYAFSQSLSLSSASNDPQTPGVTTSLEQNYPNPFNPMTTLSFNLAKDNSPVSLKIFNSKGQLIRNMVEGVLSKGAHQLVWDGTDDRHNSVGSGIYFYTLRTADHLETRKMLLVK